MILALIDKLSLLVGFFKAFSLVACSFLAKKLAFKDPLLSLKFHGRSDINVDADVTVYHNKKDTVQYSKK